MTRILFVFLSLCTFTIVQAQKKKVADAKPAVASSSYDASLFKNVNYRLLGPFRGGRSGAVTGSYKSKNTFYRSFKNYTNTTPIIFEKELNCLPNSIEYIELPMRYPFKIKKLPQNLKTCVSYTYNPF